MSVIVESSGRVEVIGSNSNETSTVEHEPQGPEEEAGVAAAASDDDANTPFSADLSLDTPKSYMSATGRKGWLAACCQMIEG